MGPRLRISQHRRPETSTADKQAARRDGGSGGARWQGDDVGAVAEEVVMAMAMAGTAGRWQWLWLGGGSGSGGGDGSGGGSDQSTIQNM